MNNVTDRQGLNDQAMASIFKVMKLDFALDAQDEVDRRSLNLMGLTNTSQGANVNHALNNLQNNNEIASQAILDPIAASPLLANSARGRINTPQEPTVGVRPIGNQNQTLTSGKFIKKLRASTKIPIEHKL